MVVSYDEFVAAFLAKIREFSFLCMPEGDRIWQIDGYLRRACSSFQEVCELDLSGNADTREFDFGENVTQGQLDDIIEIISEGMTHQWLKPYINNAEILRNSLNTSDFSTYSPAELLYRMTNRYNQSRTDFKAMINDYSYKYGDLTDLHT